jgi:hypothetical protein
MAAHDAALSPNAELGRHAAADASPVRQVNPAAAVANDYQVLAEQTHHPGHIGLFRDSNERMPVAAQMFTARPIGSDLGERYRGGGFRSIAMAAAPAVVADLVPDPPPPTCSET